MWIRKLFKKIYFNEDVMTQRDYKISRTMSIVEGSTARVIFNLTSGAFIAGFAKLLGASDQLNGILGAIPVLSSVVQILSPMVFEKLTRRKFLISIMCFIHRLLLGMIVFIPIMVRNTTIRLSLLLAAYLVAYLLVSFISPPVGSWIINLVPESIRGRYFGMRESYILVFVMVTGLASGKVIDILRQRGEEYNGFLIVFIFVILIAIVNFCALSAIKEPPSFKSTVSLDIRSILATPLKDKRFRKIIGLFILWNIGLQVGGPFFAVYMVTGLKLEYTYIMALGLLGTIANIATVRLWGRLADKKSWILTTELSIGLLAITHFCWFFVSPGRLAFILMPVLNITGGIAWAGINISLFNIQFIFSPENGRTVYLGFNAALSGLVGFASTLAGSAIISVLMQHKFDIFNIAIGNMQVVFGISGILLGVCALFVHNFINGSMKEDAGTTMQ